MMPLSTLGTISTDLSHAETILQIADSLDQLELVTQNIFNGIRRRIEDNVHQLENIDQRIKIAGDKVESLKQKKHRYTILYASAKYPAPDYQDYETCLSNLPNRSIRKPYSQIHKSRGSNSNIERGLDQREIKEKLTFYHVKPKPKPATGLFEPPPPKSASPFLWSSSSYLLFNTAESPFGNVNAFLDPFDVGSKKNKNWNSDKPDSAERQGLQEAPSSLSNARALEDPFNENFYIPDLGDLPDFELPDFLPDLPGIAQNLAFANDLEDLPDIPFFEEKSNVNQALPTPAVLHLSQPPLPTIEEVIPEPRNSRPTPPLPPTEAPPTLPDPLPDLSMAEQPKPSDVPDSGPSVRPAPAAVVDEGRASLMDAIRKAGGSKAAGLKSVREQKADEKKSKEAASKAKAGKAEGGGGDLMSDLANKLAMRRKGISGVQRAEAPGPGVGARTSTTTMSKISSMIPPPPKTSERVVSDVSDDDWN